MSQGQFDIHEGPDLNGVVSKNEVNPFINNKFIASSTLMVLSHSLGGRSVRVHSPA
jgi:hypothetical protein